jgi:hypothetical protein
MTAPIVIETVRKDNAVDRPNALTRLRLALSRGSSSRGSCSSLA